MEDRVSDRVQNWKADSSCGNKDEYKKYTCDWDKMVYTALYNQQSRASEGRREQSDPSHVADLLVSRQGSLSSVKPDVFSGDILKYPQRISFEAAPVKE